MSLQWHRRAVGGLGIYADGAEHRYYVYRMSGRRPWVVKIVPLLDGPVGVRVASNLGVAYDEGIESQKLAKAIAEAFEVEPDQHQNRQNRLTRAINAAYRA